ncbi:hypothetical protein [Methylotuvimicrobium sp. KM2]|uniref:hypothetical protein n=1 Tax=Methylotuvimicrobium sp. KM2 TaxID=3133976 RepID=UPI0031010867
MHQFIFDLITARGWSIRHLGEMTNLSYSGIRDHLKGLPHRLSDDRLNRVHQLLNLDHRGLLQQKGIYTWTVEASPVPLAALNRVFRVTTELVTNTTNARPTPGADPYKFTATPILGGGVEGLPATFWVFNWQEIYVVVKWKLPKSKVLKKTPNYYVPKDSGRQSLEINPNIEEMSFVTWAPGMELSPKRISGIHLTPAELNWLSDFDTEDPDSLGKLKELLQKKPTEDRLWAAKSSKRVEWTWDLLLLALRDRYETPEEAARKLKL